MIPYGKQDLSEADIKAVVEVLESDFITQGPKVPEFEQRLASYCDTAFAVAVNSATSALHLGCLALGVGPGDRVWTSPITFVASANCARYCGADVDFVDIDPDTFNLCPKKLKQKLTAAREQGKLPKVVIPVHMAGQSCDMAAISQLAQEFGFAVIEDASHAVGGSYNGYKVGSCRYSDITVFSFHPVKIMTTAEGGMALTNHPALAERMASLRSHGVARARELLHDTSQGDWYYEQQCLGFNYRMTEIQAALGVSQLGRLDSFIASRQEKVADYAQLLSDLPLQLPTEVEDVLSAWHLYIVRVDEHRAGLTRAQIFDFCRQAGVGVHVHYIPVHTQPYYREQGFQPGDFPVSETYYQQALSLPMFATLSRRQQQTVSDVLHRLLIQ